MQTFAYYRKPLARTRPLLADCVRNRISYSVTDLGNRVATTSRQSNTYIHNQSFLSSAAGLGTEPPLMGTSTLRKRNFLHPLLPAWSTIPRLSYSRGLGVISRALWMSQVGSTFHAAKEVWSNHSQCLTCSCAWDNTHPESFAGTASNTNIAI